MLERCDDATGRMRLYLFLSSYQASPARKIKTRDCCRFVYRRVRDSEERKRVNQSVATFTARLARVVRLFVFVFRARFFEFLT
jgi:hypothetical protein